MQRIHSDQARVVGNVDERVSFYSNIALPSRAEQDPPAGFCCTMWQCVGIRLKPTGFQAFPWIIWGFCHHARIFRGRDYRVLVLRHEAEVVHRAAQFPPYFRFPFMEVGDLQIGDVWTAPACRGMGLATWSLSHILRLHPGRRIWYLTHSSNETSRALAEQCGFQWVGDGHRTRPLGVRAFGRFVLERSSGD